MKPQLSRLTIAAREPRTVADFYRRVFELRTVQETERAFSLSDGTFNLGLIPVPPQRSVGLDYIGFHVEKIREIRERFETGGTIFSPPDGDPYTEILVRDPDGNLIGLSERGFGMGKEKTAYPIRHVALFTPNPRQLCDFYTGHFGMREVNHTDRSSIFVSDGHINLALLFQRTEERLGYNHFGFHVMNNDEIRQSAEKAGGSAGARRPDRIPYAEFRIYDPERNGIDVSQKGWET